MIAKRPMAPKKFQNWWTKSLSHSELSRGYVFITRSKAARELLDRDGVEVRIGGLTFERRKIDVSGRVHVPRAVLETVGKKGLRIRVASRRRIIMEPADA